MSTYAPPVSELLQLGEPELQLDSIDYACFGFTLDHVTELIRLMRDPAFAWDAVEKPEDYAKIHAWRVLGQLRAEAAIEPLLDILTDQEDDEKYSEWMGEEVPRMLGMIGPAAIPDLASRFERDRRLEWAPVYYCTSLAEIAKGNPEWRSEVIRRLTQILESPSLNHPNLNGYVVGDLVDLKAVEAWPAIERAFESGDVDDETCGTEEDVKYELGLGPKPPPRQAPAWTRFHPPHGPNAKQRFNERQRQKKAEKKRLKMLRKAK